MHLTLTLDTSDLGRSDVVLLQAIAGAVAPGFMPQTDTVVSVDGSTIVPVSTTAPTAVKAAPAKAVPAKKAAPAKAAAPAPVPEPVAAEPDPVEEPADDDDDDVLGTTEEAPTLKMAIARATALVGQGKMADVKAALSNIPGGAKKVTEVAEENVAALWVLLPVPDPED